jgi:thiol-activated cytolysin
MGAFEYAAGYSVDGTLTSRYEKILKESSIDLVTIGGNAAVATEPISSANVNSAQSILNKVREIISGENAVYSRDNPGVPIAYSVYYLKDNSLAKLGYTTEYTANECVTTQSSNTIQVYLGNFNAIKDCDGLGKGAGDFRVKVQILDQNNRRLTSDYPSNSDYKKVYLNSGEKQLLNSTKSFTLPINSGNKFSVKLICYEKDDDIWGNQINDSRMNGKTATRTYSYENGVWTPGPTSYSLSVGDGGCEVRLDYSVTIQ